MNKRNTKKNKGNNKINKSSKGDSKNNRFIVKLFTIIFLAIFTGVFFVGLFFNTNDLIHFRMIRAFYIGATILGTLLLSFYINSFFKDKLLVLHRRWIYIVLGIMVFIMQLIIAKSIYFDVGWDVSAIIKNAEFLVNEPTAFEHDYFLMYPNNLFLLFIFSSICKIANSLAFIDYKFLLVVINIIMVDLTILMTILTARKLFNKKSVIVTIILFTFLFAFSPWIIVPYSDTLSMLFPISIFYFYLLLKSLNSKKSTIENLNKESKSGQDNDNKEMDKPRVSKNKDRAIFYRGKQIIILVSIGLLATVGFQIKPTVIIVLVAILIAEFLINIKCFKSFILYIAAIGIVLLSFVTAKGFYDKSIENFTINGHNLSDRDDVEFPFTHFAMMGLQKVYVENRGTIYGAYVPEDVVYTESFVGKEAKTKANIEEIKRRLKGFGPKGYLEFIIGKGLWVLSDGSFYYGGEGHFMISEPYSQGAFAKEVQKVFLHTGDKFFGLVNIFQGAWILILFLIMYPILEKDRFNFDNNVFVIRLSITGIVLFLVLFEARSRYLINHIPFFILLASYGFNFVNDRFLKEIKK